MVIPPTTVLVPRTTSSRSSFTMFDLGGKGHRNSIIKGPPSRRAERRRKRAAKFTSGFAWFLSATSILLLLLLNTAGSSLDKSGDPSGTTIAGQQYSILSLTVPYKDVEKDGSLAWVYRFYLSAACAEPKEVIDSSVGPWCLYTTPGRTFNIHELLQRNDQWIKEYEENHFHKTGFPLPTMTALRNDPPTISTALPFGFYLASMVLSFILLVTLPRGCCGMEWFFGRKLMNVIIATCSLTCSCVASGLLTYWAKSLQGELSRNGFPTFIKEPTLGTGYLSLVFGSVSAMFIALVLLIIERAIEKRDITYGDRQVWKVGDNWLFGRFRRHGTFMKIAGGETGEESNRLAAHDPYYERRRSASSPPIPGGNISPRPLELDSSPYDPYRGAPPVQHRQVA